MRRKKESEYAVKKSFSLPGKLFSGAEEAAKILGYGCFSDYLQHLIRADLRARETVSSQSHRLAA
jgi:hypothetical protein